jgi:hypothetical protein
MLSGLSWMSEIKEHGDEFREVIGNLSQRVPTALQIDPSKMEERCPITIVTAFPQLSHLAWIYLHAERTVQRDG